MYLLHWISEVKAVAQLPLRSSEGKEELVMYCMHCTRDTSKEAATIVKAITKEEERCHYKRLTRDKKESRTRTAVG